MLNLHPDMLESLSRAVAHILGKRGGMANRQEVDELTEHLFTGLVQGPDRTGADWNMTWGYLISYFMAQGANRFEANQLALSHFTGIVIEVCNEVSQGKRDAEVDSLEKLELYIRWIVDRVIEADFEPETA